MFSRGKWCKQTSTPEKTYKQTTCAAVLHLELSVMTKENTLYLISLVKSYGCLWNPRDSGYKNVSNKQNAWINISEMMGYSVEKVKDKWINMRNCFLTWHSKSVGNAVKHKWFAYDALRFLEGIPHDKLPGDGQPNNTFKSQWTNERKLHLINLVKRNECLWNTTCPNYKDALIQQNAWKAISKAMGYSEDDLKFKWASLRAVYLMYHSRAEKGSETEKSSKYVSAQNWYAYEPLQFLTNQHNEHDPLGPGLKADEDIASQPKDDPLNEKVADSEITTLVNIRDKTVVCKSINGVKSKSPINSLSTDPKPQAQVGNALRIDRRSQPWMNEPVPVKRTSPLLVQDPLRIKPKAQTQLNQDGTQAKPVQNVHRVSLGGRPTLNPSSVKSFVNLIEHELGELSSDYATMAQVDIYKIIGEYRLKDVRRSFEKSSESEASESKKAKIVHPVVTKRNEHPTVKIEPSVELECEEDAS